MPLPPTVDADKASRRLTTRDARFVAREFLWDLDRGDRVHRVANCGRYSTGDAVTIKVTNRGGVRSAGFGGVQSCGSVWACPVCSEKVNAERQAELDAGISSWLDAGHAVMFGTATLSHGLDDDLADLLGAISPSWNRVTSGAGAQWSGSKPRKDGTRSEIGDRARFGIEGYCRVVEIKHGSGSGWHPHVHFLLFLDVALHPRQALDLESRLFGRWEAALGARGFTTLEGIGMDLRPVRKGEGLADYFTKSNFHTSATGAAYEVTGSVSKRAGKGGRTPFDILRDITANGELQAEGAPVDNVTLWEEYETATLGLRQLTWSRGLRALLALGVERSAEEIVEDDDGGEVVLTLHGPDYGRLAAQRVLSYVLRVAEYDDGGRALRRALDRLGVVPIFLDAEGHPLARTSAA